MSDQQTIADSKRAFHHAFPYVIPPLYRRTADELLVELNLLSHQKQFKADALFAVGLAQVFDAFTLGYQPQEHLKPLFEALCHSSEFDPNALRDQATKTLETVSGHNVEQVEGWLKNEGRGAPEALAQGLNRIGSETFHYSRLMAVGLLSVLSAAKGEEASDPQQLSKKAHELCDAIGFSKARVEKDLNLYNSNLEKMAQAVEMMEETLASERRKLERQKSESASLETPQENSQELEAQSTSNSGSGNSGSGDSGSSGSGSGSDV